MPIEFTPLLMKWYKENARILPWREDSEPYHVWLSEIMLQQTGVETVKGYYKRFLEKLPDIETLANAQEDVYTKLWEGLGYYSRVRNLHKGAKQIMEEYGGKMPSEYNELLNISGIGPYTAAAIASIAFQKREPAIDGNLLRIFARLTSYKLNIKENAAKKAAHSFFMQYIPKEKPGDFNQALMDLGSALCTPNKAPLCFECPISSFCVSYQKGEEADYPVYPEKKKRKIEKRTVFLIHDNGKIAICKREKEGLLAGLYEFPNTENHLNQKAAINYIRRLGFSPIRIRRLDDAKHIFSHKEWHMIGYEVIADTLEPYTSFLNPSVQLKENERKYGEDDIKERDKNIILSSFSDIKKYYSIPSAFKKYKEYLREDVF